MCDTVSTMLCAFESGAVSRTHVSHPGTLAVKITELFRFHVKCVDKVMPAAARALWWRNTNELTPLTLKYIVRRATQPPN